MRIEHEITLDASPEEIYDVVMDPERLGDWVTIHEDVSDAPPGVLQKDARMCQRLRLAGKGFDVRWLVTVADRGRQAVWTGEGPARSDAISEFHFYPNPGGTRFGYVLELKPPGGLLGAFASRAVLSTSLPQRELEHSLERLKGLLEG